MLVHHTVIFHRLTERVLLSKMIPPSIVEPIDSYRPPHASSDWDYPQDKVSAFNGMSGMFKKVIFRYEKNLEI